MKHAVRHIHFVGIGGVGMSGIAEVLFNLGYTISGSDLADSVTLKRLGALGITTSVGMRPATSPTPTLWSPQRPCSPTIQRFSWRVRSAFPSCLGR